MAIVNRDLDASEQRRSLTQNYGAVATGATVHVAFVPTAGTLEAVKVAVAGLSGSPTYDLRVLRFIAGAGVTSIAGAATTLTGVAVGTSGVQSMVLAASGSSFLNLMAGDVLTLTAGAANTNVLQLSCGVVVKAIQDIKTQFGV